MLSADSHALISCSPAQLRLEFHTHIRDLSQADWQILAGDHPFLDYALLRALEETGAVGAGTGWQPRHLAVYLTGSEADRLVAVMPLYEKWHSYGEYVFDWAWADALERAGLPYYPKLLSAIPFSPVTGPRVLLHPQLADATAIAKLMLQTLQTLSQQQGYSGVHVLFPDAASSDSCHSAGWLMRQGVQFRWENPGYAHWEDFLAQLSHDKRKKIRQERAKVSRAGVVCQHLNGHTATAAHWDFFYQCYVNTYHLHGSQPYLPKTFFLQLAQHMPQQLALFVAYQAQAPVAASLCLHNQHTLYGRYWGALADISCLHFELCYYQPQQFCISHGLRYFEGGAQGVHKLARGFTPYPTCSWHWLQHAGLQQAVADFLQREQQVMAHSIDELEERSPYRKG